MYNIVLGICHGKVLIVSLNPTDSFSAYRLKHQIVDIKVSWTTISFPDNLELYSH